MPQLPQYRPGSSSCRPLLLHGRPVPMCVTGRFTRFHLHAFAGTNLKLKAWTIEDRQSSDKHLESRISMKFEEGLQQHDASLLGSDSHQHLPISPDTCKEACTCSIRVPKILGTGPRPISSGVLVLGTWKNTAQAVQFKERIIKTWHLTRYSICLAAFPKPSTDCCEPHEHVMNMSL